MIQITNKSECCGCSACVQRCPKQSISMQQDKEGFSYPHVDTTTCIDCGLCEKVCPVLNQGEIREPIVCYAAKHKEENVRKNSSSGGVFTLLAERIINQGGVVFGVKIDESYEIVHSYTETKDGLKEFQGSKYVQSRIGDTFKDVESFLKQNRKVLFSGTPCQVSALKLFLHKEYENLLCLDFICHGVPSPGVYRRYLTETAYHHALQPLQARLTEDAVRLPEGYKFTKISFRDKCEGWINFSMSTEIKDSNNRKYIQSLNLWKDPFLKGFLRDWYLRPSCHQCPAKELKSGADITIADYWDVNLTYPEFADDKGVSAVIVNTLKGEELFFACSLDKIVASYDDIRKKNPAVYRSPKIPVERELFWQPTNESLVAKIERMTYVPIYKRVIITSNRIVRKIVKTILKTFKLYK